MNYTHLDKGMPFVICEVPYGLQGHLCPQIRSGTAFIGHSKGFPGGAVVKNRHANAGGAGDGGLTPGSGRSPGGGHGRPLQYSCLEKSMDRGAWKAIVHRVSENPT